MWWRVIGCLLDMGVLPGICLVGLALNVACLRVFVRTQRHPLVPALTVLSICDLLQLLLSLFVLFLPAFHDYAQMPPFGALGQLAYLSTGLLSPLLLASNSASIWTICYISIQRHKAILRPLSSMRTPPSHTLPLLLITLAALLFNASKWSEFDWEWIPLAKMNGSDEVIPSDTGDSSGGYFLWHQPSELAHNKLYRKITEKILYPTFVYLIPLCLLAGLNFRILTSISMRRVSCDHKSRLAQEKRSVTLLISIVLLFFCCHTGGLAIRFIDLRFYQEEEWFVFVKDIINLLFNINSFANPMLYFFFTRQFRDLRQAGRDQLHTPNQSTVGTSCGGHPRLTPKASYSMRDVGDHSSRRPVPGKRKTSEPVAVRTCTRGRRHAPVLPRKSAPISARQSQSPTDRSISNSLDLSSLAEERTPSPAPSPAPVDDTPDHNNSLSVPLL